MSEQKEASHRSTAVATNTTPETAALEADDDALLLSPDVPNAASADGDSRRAAIDPAVHRFPFCLVWSPIPILTWFLPFIGHLGLADSKGVIFDFAGPYTIGRDNFAFGVPTRYLQCEVAAEDAAKWDDAVAKGCAIYETRMHNLCCDNCHSHVAVCLEHMRYRGRPRWNMVELCFWMFFCGTYVDLRGVLKSWLPFAFVVALVVIVSSTS